MGFGDPGRPKKVTYNFHFPGWGKLENMGSGRSHRRRRWEPGFKTYFPLQGEPAPGERSSRPYGHFKILGYFRCGKWVSAIPAGQKKLHIIFISQGGESWKIWVPAAPTGAGGGSQGLKHTFHCRANQPLASVLLVPTATLRSWGISGAGNGFRRSRPAKKSYI